MNGGPTGRELTALMIAPDRALAQAFERAGHAFQVLAELKEYPAQAVLEMRLRQLRPDVVLLDLASDFTAASGLIRFIAAAHPAVHVVGLHARNDSEAIVTSLRLGASEFLYAPFDPEIQRQAVARLLRLIEPAPPPARAHGKVVVFASGKPGSGASMLAAQAGFALRRLTGSKVLLADLDLLGGTISFYLKLTPRGSLVDLLESSDPASNWMSWVAPSHGLEVLAAPDLPVSESIEPARLHEFLEYARQRYQWVILGLPAIFNRLSLLALSEADQAFLVSTAELPSLHLTRKAVNLLAQIGVGRERFRVLINRQDKRGLRGPDVEKIVNCPVHASFPNDYFSLDRAVTLGEPLAEESELGRSISEFARWLAGAGADAARSNVAGGAGLAAVSAAMERR